MAGVLSLKTPSTGLVTLTPTDTATDKTITLPATTGTVVIQDGTSTATVVNLAYTGTLTGGTGVVNIGSGQVYKDASGNVGIGTASPAQKLHVVGTSRFDGDALVTTGYSLRLIESTNNNTYLLTNSSNNLTFVYNASERMRIDSSGNVGIGTSSPSTYGKLTVNDTAASSVYIRSSSTNFSGLSLDNTNSATKWQIGVEGGTYNTAGILNIGVSGVGTALAIDTNRNVLVGTTSLYSGAGAKVSVSWDSGGEQGIALKTSSATFNGNAIIFLNNVNVASGFISQSLTTVTYNTTSDYRLKENVLPMTGALEKIAALKPVTYTWKADGSNGQGFIAHELQAVVPDCVTGTKDAIDKDGKPQHQGVDTSFLVATVVAALQELKAEFDAYKLTHP